MFSHMETTTNELLKHILSHNSCNAKHYTSGTGSSEPLKRWGRMMPYPTVSQKLYIGFIDRMCHLNLL